MGAKMNKLDAINLVLESVGEAPLDSLAEATFEEATRAVRYIDRETADLLATGWYFNRKVYTLTPNGSGELTVPAGCIRLDLVQEYPNGMFQVIDGKVVKIGRGTMQTTFTESLNVTLVMDMPFDNITDYFARAYIAKRAAVSMQEALIGSGEKNNRLEKDAMQAFAALQQTEMGYTNYNMGDSMNGWYNQGVRHTNDGWYS